MSAEKSSLKEVLSSIEPEGLVEAWKVFGDKINDETDPETAHQELDDIFEGMEVEYPAFRKALDSLMEASLEERGVSTINAEWFCLGAITFAGALKELADQQELRHIIGE